MTERRQTPFDYADTDWGRTQEARHGENQQRFKNIEDQLRGIDEHIKLDVRADEATRKATEESRRETKERFAELNSDLTKVERHMEMDLEEHAKLRYGLTQNTALTEAIKKDTASIVGLAKAAATFRRFIVWALPLAVSVLTAYITWTLKK